MERLHLSKTDGCLILTKSRSFYARQISRMVLGISIWCIAWCFIFMIVRAGVEEIVFIGLLVLLVPVVLMPKLSDYMRIINEGQTFVFDRQNDQLLHNGTLIALISSIAYLQVYTHIARGPYEHSLFAVLTDNEKTRIDRGVDLREVLGIAEEIARYLQVKILMKDRFTPDSQMSEHVFEGPKTDLITLEGLKTRIQENSSHKFRMVAVLCGGIFGSVAYFLYRLSRADSKRE